ncbi:hypothetical protein CAPTEDRAFT_147044 [Capitella teleta]|uniref:Neuroblastoma-amplified sequence N-terminal domain-containing protein n=1 Tax=Capitella teleta TaxID=283909 RepID=R7ULC7_CAPTE|nr:hypothetical protein CAPTEDRAFT_147044 [Capitella teleta]|eukprot:ELU06903.1 hypothetical protein CAPTEDRAFT_147044 [Capitella teleta]
MKVELQVLATASIKRKKPWPALAFLGQAQESLFLLDKQRVSVLYVPSGKTKRRISSLEPLLHNTTALQYSHEGSFLVGLLTSGDAYLWHKDSNRLKFLQGFESLAYKGEIHVPACQTPHAWVSDSGRHIVASAPGFVDTLVWEAGASQPVLSPNSNQVQGSWSVIEVPAHVLLPGKANFEASSNACFCVKECIGECCLYSCVFYRGNEICVTTLLIQWLDAQQIYSYRQSTYQAEWKSKLHPLTQIDPEATPLDDPGALVTKFSNDGQLLAIAVNQNKLASCKMMYVAPCHDVVVCADLKCMGTRGGQMDAWSVRSYWVTSLQWTHDDLYLVCINGQGLVGMLTRLGEPVLLATQGLSPEIGPRFYLPLHPLSNVQ